MKFLIVQLHPFPRHLILLRPNIVLRTLYLNTLSLCSYLSVRDQISHPYKTTKLYTLAVTKYAYTKFQSKVFDPVGCRKYKTLYYNLSSLFSSEVKP
jgi:hypothetical protein